MALDDRERNFEKAMARELRGDALNGLHCPDAETLAAYHERLLSPEEMTAQKSHIAGCARCQETLATLEVTETVSNQAEQSESAGATKDLRALSALPRSTASKVREIPKRNTYLRWVVPAGAVAAGMLVWIAINSSWNQRKAAPYTPTQVAENRKQQDSQLIAPKTDTGAPAAKSPAMKSDTDLKHVPKEEADKLATDRLQERGRIESRTATNFPHGPSALQNQVQNQMQKNAQANDYALRQNKSEEGARVGAGLGESRSTAAPASVPSPVSADRTSDLAARKDEAVGAFQVAEGGAANEAKPPAKEKKAAAEAQRSLRLAQGATTMTTAGLLDTNGTEISVIRTSDPRVFWVVTPEGAAVRSEGGGKRVLKQDLGSGVKAIAGSATDGKTCWLLAEGNAVFRTVDGGKHWLQVSTPNGAEFRAIVATDALRATVTDAGGATKFVTIDGGATWTRAKE